MQALVTTGSWNPLASTNIAGDDPVNANSHQHSHLHSSILSDISKLPMIGAQDRLQPLLSRVSYKGRGQRSRSNGLRPVCTFPSVISLTKAIVN